MATTSDTITTSQATDADYRLFITKMDAMLLAAGYVDNGDTGQLDMTTAVRPASGVYGGYRMYKLGSTNPIILKVEYGTHNAVARNSIRVSFATSSTGAGVLNGPLVSAAYQLGFPTTDASGTFRPIYATSWNGGAAVYIVDSTGTSRTYGIVIERFRDVNGDPTAEGFTFTIWGNSTTSMAITEQVVQISTGLLKPTNTKLTCLHGTGSAGADGTDIGVFPQVPFVGKARYPNLGVIAHFFTDIGTNANFTATRYGVSRTYKSVISNAGAYTVSTVANNMGFAILFD